MRKRALIVVDMQNDFMPGGALAVTEGDEIVPIVNKLIDIFTLEGELVVKTRDWHPEANNVHFAAFGGRWPAHCIQNTKGAAFFPDLRTAPNEMIIDKGTTGEDDGYSAFDGTQLAPILRGHGITDLWVVGLATDYCVKATVLDGIKEKFTVTVILDAVRAVDSETGAEAVTEMVGAGARVMVGEPYGSL
jgi:nicotinamidase/pyrazinamidase